MGRVLGRVLGLGNVGIAGPAVRESCSLLPYPLPMRHTSSPHSGARLVKILYGKYVAQSNWRLELFPAPRAVPPDPAAAVQAVQGQAAAAAAAAAPHAAVLGFLDSVLQLVNGQVNAAREELLPACRRSLAHGPLLLLRYVAEDVPWQALAAGGGGTAAAAEWAARALAAVSGVVDVALPVLSRPQVGRRR